MQKQWVYSFEEIIPENWDIVVATALADWQAHGRRVKTRVSIIAKHFLLVEALSDTSGCGIDKLERIIRAEAAAANLKLLDNSQIGYEGVDGSVQFVDFRQVPVLLNQGILSAGTLVFDTTENGIVTKKRLADSWLKRYLAAAEKC
jgi:hypothetical protein